MNTPRYIYHGKLCPVCQIDFEQNIILIKTEDYKKEWVNLEQERIVELQEKRDVLFNCRFPTREEAEIYGL